MTAHAKRHADAERYSEARAGGNEYRSRLATFPDAYARPLGGMHLDQGVRQWTRIHREDRAADLAGMPDPTHSPILAAARHGSFHIARAEWCPACRAIGPHPTKEPTE